MLFSSFSTRSMVFAYFAKAQLPFSLFRDLFNDTAEFTLCYGLHDCSHLFQGYFIHSLSTLYYYNAPSLTTRLTGDYRDRTYTGKCSPALLDTQKRKAASAASNESPDSSEPVRSKSIADHMGFLIFLGITTGAICSLSGAGGPVLVMPLLVACGVSTRIAVGVALFDSVFIAIPACIGYLSRITWTEVLGLLVLIVLTHGIGVWLGSRFAGKVPVQGLKIFVAVFSVCIAIYMLM